eukprot:6021871-Amphidinium_carterae.1
MCFHASWIARSRAECAMRSAEPYCINQPTQCTKGGQESVSLECQREEVCRFATCPSTTEDLPPPRLQRPQCEGVGLMSSRTCQPGLPHKPHQPLPFLLRHPTPENSLEHYAIGVANKFKLQPPPLHDKGCDRAASRC